MPITEEEFKGAKPGDFLIDVFGHAWLVDKVIEGRPFFALMAYHYEKLREMLIWDNGQILDERRNVVMEFNCPGARFKPRA